MNQGNNVENGGGLPGIFQNKPTLIKRNRRFLSTDKNAVKTQQASNK